MGDLAIESGQFKVGATAKDAQEMVKAKLDEGDLFDDITKVCSKHLFPPLLSIIPCIVSPLSPLMAMIQNHREFK